jgi:hypothetical protein
MCEVQPRGPLEVNLSAQTRSVHVQWLLTIYFGRRDGPIFF